MAEWPDAALPEALEEALNANFPNGWVVTGFRRDGGPAIFLRNPEDYTVLQSIHTKCRETVHVWDAMAAQSERDTDDEVEGVTDE